MKKRFNVYSMGRLILKDQNLDSFKSSIRLNQAFLQKVRNLNYNEIVFFKDPDTGRRWEYERIA